MKTILDERKGSFETKSFHSYVYSMVSNNSNVTLILFCQKIPSVIPLVDLSRLLTDGSRILHTLLVKHYNDLLDRQSSERGKDEVTYFYVGDVFCIHLGTKYADFQEKIFAEISGKKFQTLGIT